MKAKLKNLLTGDIIDVHSTTDSVDSSYGLECWVDKKGNSYGQCQFGAPLGFELVECDTPTDQFINPGFIKDYFSRLGKKGGSSRTPKKSASSAANLDKARAGGKTGGYPKNRKREINAYMIRNKTAEDVPESVAFEIIDGGTFYGSISNTSSAEWAYHAHNGQFERYYETIAEFVEDTGYEYKHLKRSK